MSWFAHIALLMWIPAVLVLFTLLPPRRAVITALLTAWLFLPMGGYSLPGLPDYTKLSATCIGVLIGAAMFDPVRFQQFRANWIDLPMLMLCLSPAFASISNELGWRDALSASLDETVMWGAAYAIGRLYFSDPDGVKELAVAVFVGGLLYMPLCLFEIRMSPRLHLMFYGYHQAPLFAARRGDGFKPLVFMQSGLMVSMWMGATALTGLWLWRSRIVTTVRGIPAGFLCAAMVGTTVWCRSLGATMLLGFGAALLFGSRLLGSRILMISVLVAIPAYCLLRANQVVSSSVFLGLAESTVHADRAASLRVRLENEDQLTEKAMERPIFGWGRWGRSRIYDSRGRNLSLTDGLWVILLGQQGGLGLAALLAAFLGPPMLLLRKLPPRLWQDPRCAPAVVLSVVLILYMLDCLMNAMVNPVFTVVAGALAGLVQHAATNERRSDARVPAVAQMGRIHAGSAPVR